MKAQTPFWPLLKNEMGFGSWMGVVPFAAVMTGNWFVAGMLPLTVLFADHVSAGNISSLFEAGILPVMAFLYISCLAMWMPYTTIPAFCDLFSPDQTLSGSVQNLGAFEFLFTRAVDRRRLFRAKSTALFVLVLAPLWLSLVVSPLAPDVTFSRESPLDPVARLNKYIAAFPSSHTGATRPEALPERIVIPHGAVTYTAWMAWSATLACLVLQAYLALIARRVKSNNWWTALFPGLPVLGLMVAFGWLAHSSFLPRRNYAEDSFLFFATHPVALMAALAGLAVLVQIWCERRFSQLELL